MEKIVTSPIEGRRWGLWSTLGFSLIIIVLYFAVQFAVAAIMYGVQYKDNPELDADAFAASLANDGLYLSLGTIITAWLCMILIISFVLIRQGITVKQYLHLTAPPLKTLIGWLGITFVFLIAWERLYSIFELPESDFLINIYKTDENHLLLWIAIVLAAPVLEEFFFRGFLFEGLRGSRLGSIGAVIITSGFWAILHIQYGQLEIAMIVLLGLIFGIAKIQTRSLYTTLAMHILVNLTAMVEVSMLIEKQ